MHRFVGLGDSGSKIFLHDAPDGKKVRQVLWGDYLDIGDGTEQDGWYEVKWHQSGKPPLSRYIRVSDTIETRPLEIIFLDVGQGDASVLISPNTGDGERIMLLDAGIGDNLDRFLSWRFKYRKNRLRVHAAVITHPDEDHYGGFQPVFENPLTRIEHVYINGLGERHKDQGPRLGATEVDAGNGKTYQTDLLVDDAQIRAFYGKPDGFGDMAYPRLLRTAIARGADVGTIGLLAPGHGDIDPTDGRTYMPGFAPQAKLGYTIEVIGPVVELVNGKPGLRRLESNDGKTKNGHSVLLRLEIKGFTMLFGGDLNRASEQLLLMHYAGVERWPTTTPERAQMIESAKVRLKSDVLKVCHHGSSDVTDEFLQAVDPVAFVVSSGDEEGHVHPRPDLLGRLGRNGRSFAPLILSTELQRSTREQEDKRLSETVTREARALAGLDGEQPGTPERRQKRLAAIQAAVDTLARRNVEVYGAIHVKTDGQRLIVAFRNESKSQTKLWHYYEYRKGPNNTLIATHEVTP